MTDIALATGPDIRTDQQRQKLGILLVSSLAAWERFSYWGMRGLLVLFLVAPAADGGFAWSEADALRFIGTFTLLFYLAPPLGGYVADKWLGRRNGMLLGSVLLTLGHLLLAGPALAPRFVEWQTGQPVGELLVSADVEIGTWPDAALEQTLAERLPAAAVEPVLSAYWLTTLSFLAGLGLIIIGGGLQIPTATALVGDHFAPGDPPDTGFTFYYALGGIGGILSNFVAGTLGEGYGWHYGFSAAGGGMALGLAFYLWKERAWFRPVRTAEQDAGPADGPSQLPPATALSLVGLAILIVFFWTIYEQSFGILSYFIQNRIDRELGSFLIPTTWFQSISPISALAIAPLLVLFWARMASRSTMPSDLAKVGYAFATVAVGTLFFLGAALEGATGAAKVNPLWIVAGMATLTLAEYILVPTGWSALTRASPAKWAGALMGAWFMADAVGSFAGGLLGAEATEAGEVPLFTGCTIAAIAVSTTLLIADRIRTRWKRRQQA